MSSLSLDYIIIGAGTAGCLLADRQYADPSKRVLLIDMGAKDYCWGAHSGGLPIVRWQLVH
jgi:choline dehydrogenase